MIYDNINISPNSKNYLERNKKKNDSQWLILNHLQIVKSINESLTLKPFKGHKALWKTLDASWKIKSTGRATKSHPEAKWNISNVPDLTVFKIYSNTLSLTYLW